MKVAILYICTGKYDIFWPEFYSSCERFFCQNIEKHYFVFTDSEQIVAQDNVSKVYQDNLGWPFNTLFRYHIFLRIQERLVNFDKIVFFNGNCIFNTKIAYDEFFGKEKSIVAGIHPGFFDKMLSDYTFEKRPASLAYIEGGDLYVAGGINGGDYSSFIDICKKLSANIDRDLQAGIVAIWHDESHWNAYINNNWHVIKPQVNLLTPDYLYPEGWQLPFEAKIILRDKSKYGGHNLLRGVGTFKQHKLINLAKKLLGKVKC
jgi:hypothetical protein